MFPFSGFFLLGEFFLTCEICCQEREIAFRVRTAEIDQVACTDCALKAMRDGAFIIEITDAERHSMG